MKYFFRYFVSKLFWINVLVAMLLCVVIYFVGNAWLNSYTHKGKDQIRIPDLTRMKTQDALQLLEQHNLKYVILDSVYLDDFAKGTVVSQDPSPYYLRLQDTIWRTAKEQRNIYLTVNASSPPLVRVPNYEHKRKSVIVSLLGQKGINCTLVPRASLMFNGSVIEILYKGEVVHAGEQIRRGETVEVVYGVSAGGAYVQVPRVIGLDKLEAKKKLNESNLNMVVSGYEDCESRRDSIDALVQEQLPAVDNDTITLPTGSEVEVILIRHDLFQDTLNAATPDTLQ